MTYGIPLRPKPEEDRIFCLSSGKAETQQIHEIQLILSNSNFLALLGALGGDFFLNKLDTGTVL